MTLTRYVLGLLLVGHTLTGHAADLQSGTLHATADEFGYVSRYSLDGGTTNELWQLYGYIGNAYAVLPTAPGSSYSQYFDVLSSSSTATGLQSSLSLNALGAGALGLTAGDILLDWEIAVNGPPVNRLVWVPTIRNASSSPLDLSFYAYLDLDVNDTEGLDTAQGGLAGAVFGEGGKRIVWTLEPEAQHYEAGPFPGIQTLLDNMTTASDLGDTGLPVWAPSDISAAWQFNLEVGAGESVRLDMELATPEPGTACLMLVGIGVGWVALARRRRKCEDQ